MALKSLSPCATAQGLTAALRKPTLLQRYLLPIRVARYRTGLPSAPLQTLYPYPGRWP